MADQFSGSFPGDGSRPELTATEEVREKEKERDERKPGARGREQEQERRQPGTLAPDPLAPSRRFPAFGKTHPIPSHPGRLVFL